MVMIIRDMCLRSGASFPDLTRHARGRPHCHHNAKFTSEVFSVLVKNMGSILIVGLAHHKNTNTKVEWANSVIRDKLRDYASGRKDSDKWDSHLTPAEFAIINTFLLLK